MKSEKIEEQVRSTSLVLSFICGQFVLGMAILVCLAYFRGEESATEGLPQMIELGLLGLALLFICAGHFLKEKVTKSLKVREEEYNLQKIKGALFSLYIIVFVLFESAGITGFILSYTSGSILWAQALAGVSMFFMILHFPSKGRIRKLLLGKG